MTALIIAAMLLDLALFTITHVRLARHARRLDAVESRL